uniref:Kinetochore protein SPC25 n=1 Tax=Chrysotila carterae TaxID=13221 RepID=A0A7S4B4Y7_CHRCT
MTTYTSAQATQAEAAATVNEELRKQMVEVQQQLAQWTSQQKQHIDSTVLQAQRTLENDKGTMQTLQFSAIAQRALHRTLTLRTSEFAENQRQAEQKLQLLKADDEALQNRLRAEERKVEELRVELERLHTQEKLLPPEQQRLAKSLEQQRQLLAQRELAYQQCQLQKETRLSELGKGCSTYQRLLSLEFERMGDERLRLVFTNLDARAPSRAFSFQVYVDALDKYHIENCEPALPNLPALTDTLNQTNDFSTFVRAVRREFKRSTT